MVARAQTDRRPGRPKDAARPGEPKWTRRPFIRLLAALLVAVSAGLLEAAWTGGGRTAPHNTLLGLIALAVVFFIVSFPKVWWVPGLAILEEFTHLLVGYGQLPTASTLFAHWSVAYTGVNLYPWITFPIATAYFEGVWLLRSYVKSRRGVATPERDGY